MVADIVSFVKSYRLSYKHNFLANTERVVPGEKFTVSAFHPDDGCESGFDPVNEESSITISFGAPSNSNIWATNVVEEVDSVRHGYIHVGPDLLDQSETYRKFILAEEWLEVMLGIQFPKHRQKAKKTAGRIQMIDLFNSIGRDTLWRDDDEELKQIWTGLQNLLVSTQSVDEFVQEFYALDLLGLIDLLNDPDKSSEAGDTLRSIERSFAASKKVRPDLVRLRMNHILFDELPNS